MSESDNICPYCNEYVDVNDINVGKDGKGGRVPNCLICDNGHRTHNDCRSKYGNGPNCKHDKCNSSKFLRYCTVKNSKISSKSASRPSSASSKGSSKKGSSKGSSKKVKGGGRRNKTNKKNKK
jgi:hypothetical protein